ncbi:rho-associated protein kinase 2-like [Cylas formicarius]|uniref:rho-associated protein kinase 2-like n=1 Tax=Cylas formicarius TaxID=197179 RepID=UPI002958B20A|nr:rho-associated protein kinase 2-like [Cylas formicarius]
MSLDVGDVTDSRVPEDILFPDELCRYLREELKTCTRENCFLRKDIAEKEKQNEDTQRKLLKLETKLKEYQDSSDMVAATPNHLVSAKIVEISKKLREKCAELESCKSKYAKLENYVLELENRSTRCEPIAEFRCEDVETKRLEEKLRATSNKLVEARDANAQLKNDLKTANEYLKRETGEELTSLLGNSKWKGKSELINELQSKNRELKDKTKMMQDTQQSYAKTYQKLTSLEQESRDVKAINEELRRKIEAIKLKYSTLNEHYEKDQCFIATLSAQVVSFEELRRDVTREKECLLGKVRNEKEQLFLEVQTCKTIINELRQQLESKNEQITELRKVKGVKEDEEEMVVAECYDAERIKILDLFETQNKRLEDARSELSKCQLALRKEKQKSAKLESALARTEAESISSNRYRSTTFLASVRVPDESLSDKLELAEENIKALTTKLELERHERRTDLKEFSAILKCSSNSSK